MRKGFVQIAFLPLLLAGFLGVVLIGFLGATADFFTTSLAKLALLGVAILTAYIAYKRIAKKPTVDTMTLGLIIATVGIILYIMGSQNMFGLQSMLP